MDGGGGANESERRGYKAQEPIGDEPEVHVQSSPPIPRACPARNLSGPETCDLHLFLLTPPILRVPPANGWVLSQKVTEKQPPNGS